MTTSRDNLKTGASGAVGALVKLTVADLLRTRRAVLLAALLLAPVAFALYWALGETLTGDALQQWGLVFVVLYLNVAVPLVALLVGATLISAERESQTLVYLLTRPVPRWKIALTKFVTGAAVCVVGIAVSMALSLLALALHARTGPGAEVYNWPEALRYGPVFAAIAAAAMVVYLAVFFLAGVALKRPVAVGVAFLVIWEGFIGFSPAILRFGCIIHYLRSLAIAATRGVVDLPGIVTVKEAPAWVAGIVLASLTLVALVLALARFSRAEYPTTPDR